jgi:hypothetical protein
VKKRLFVTMLALVVAVEIGVAIAYAQGSGAAIGFPFVAGGKEMAAGKYSVEVTPAGPVMISGPGGARVILPVITSLGRHDRDTDAEFVFDKVDGKTVLSEIWIPGRDGLLVLATKGPHEHAVVGGSNPRK